MYQILILLLTCRGGFWHSDKLTQCSVGASSSKNFLSTWVTPQPQCRHKHFANFVQVFHLLFWQPMHGLFPNSTGRCSQASYYPSKPAFVRPARRLCDPSCVLAHSKICKGWTLHSLHRPICIANMHLSWYDILPLQLQHAISPSPPLLFKHHWKPSSVL